MAETDKYHAHSLGVAILEKYHVLSIAMNWISFIVKEITN